MATLGRFIWQIPIPGRLRNQGSFRRSDMREEGNRIPCLDAMDHSSYVISSPEHRSGAAEPSAELIA